MNRKKPLRSEERRNGIPINGRKAVKYNGSWAIVWVDQTSLRETAARDCASEMARLEKVRAQLQCFKQDDQPMFESWLAQNFGAILSQLRENRQIIDEKESLIREVELAVLFGDARSHRSAYRQILEDRADFDREFSERDSGNDFSRGSREDFSEEEDFPREFSDDDAGDSEGEEGDDELLFRSILEEQLGVDPDDLSRAEYNRLFAEFQREVLGKKPSGAAKTQEGSPEYFEEQSKAERVKELYRQLVRRLHPDMRPEGSGASLGLWHEVQEAYVAGDLERLEVLFALSEVADQNVSSSTTLFQMRVALKELRRSLQAVYCSLAAAKKEDAWGFASLKNYVKLQKKMERRFAKMILNQTSTLQQLEAILKKWESPRRAQSSKKAKQRKA